MNLRVKFIILLFFFAKITKICTFVVMETIVQCKNIIHSYDNLSVICGVNLDVTKGEVLSIVGRSGAGKSTLLQIMASLLAPTSGEVLIGGRDITQLGDKELSAFRANNIGFVFQAHHLLTELTALENVILPAVIAKRDAKAAEARAVELLEMMGLKDRMTHKPATMSGGEQQRVAVARALINNPMVLFADEPTGNLDTKSRDELNEIFLNLRDTMGQTLVIVTHEMKLAGLCDRVVEMSDGLVL